eukprot:1051666-Prymnesium_polylepis.1
MTSPRISCPGEPGEKKTGKHTSAILRTHSNISNQKQRSSYPAASLRSVVAGGELCSQTVILGAATGVRSLRPLHDLGRCLLGRCRVRLQLFQRKIRLHRRFKEPQLAQLFTVADEQDRVLRGGGAQNKIGLVLTHHEEHVAWR